MRSVLCIDDKMDELQALEFYFQDFYQVITCRDGAKAATVLRRERPSAVILDIQMPGYDGFKVLRDLRNLPDPPPVLMLSGYSEPLFVVRALREGASDFIAKPYNFSMLRRRVERIIDQAGNQPDQTASHGGGSSLLVGDSAAMRAVRQEIAAYAPSPLPVLLLGESGTGKDVAAREIHRASPRRSGPYEVRNLAAIPDTLVGSELFGSEAGAFTDARSRQGCFETAHGGTLFLDEIGDANTAVQAALLRIVDDGVVRRLGGNREYHVDTRLVCATNHDLDALIAQGRFRADLKYRIEGLTIRIPPLRDRKEDIPVLVGHFLKGMPGANHPEPCISEKALAGLLLLNWPGNVRQLKNCVDRAWLLSQGKRIETQHFRGCS